MIHFKNILATILAAVMSISMLSATAIAQERTNVLVMAEGGDEGSINRQNRIVRRVTDAIHEQMNAVGFAVYDQDVVTYGTIDQDVKRFTRGELIDIAKTSVYRPGGKHRIKIRAAATFEVFVNVTKLGYTNKVRTRVTGRMFDVQSGRFLGNYELVDPAGEIRLHPKKCQSRDCALELIGDHARDIGAAIGNELAEMLADDKGGYEDSDGYIEGTNVTEYSLVFENVTAREMRDFEYYLVEVFSGYRSHAPISSTSMKHAYEYVSTATSARIKRNLERVIEELNWKGKVFMDGDNFTVKKRASRSSRKPDRSTDRSKW